MVAGFATDFVYVLTAIWESFPPRAVIRWWGERMYRRLASRYDRHIVSHSVYGAPLEAALRRVGIIPQRILDVSTGTGFAAARAAQVFPSAVIVGCDLSWEMLERARIRTDAPTLVRCDSAWMPFRTGAFDLVIVQNAPPPIREVARVVQTGGVVVLGFSSGARLPGWVITRLSTKLRELGCGDVVWDNAGDGLYVLARKGVEAAA